MARTAAIEISVALFLVLLTILPGTMGVKEEGTKDVNIEKYIEFRIEFDQGDALHLEADIQSTSPVSVFLVKGEKAYGDWVASEDVDVQAIMNGTDVSNLTKAFQVIENFSQDNITHFSRSIDIGEKDTYFLVIALHRDSSMTTDDVMSRASQVHYRISWNTNEKEIPWGLLSLAIVLFLIGAALIVTYFVLRRRAIAAEDAQSGAIHESIPESSGPRKQGRAPPWN